jgi:type IV pilus assembly protein PilW
MSSRMPSGSTSTRANRGFTLIELLVGIAISLVIVVAAAAMYISTAGIGRSSLRAAEIQGNGQQAMDALRRDLIAAGFRGLTGDPDQLSPAAAVSVSNDCESGFAMNLRQAVWASNDANPFSATSSCIPSTASYLRGDVLAIRRLGAVLPSGTTPESTRLYLRSAFQAGQYFVGSSPPLTFGYTPSVDYVADASVYFIRSSTANESPQVPALYRVRLVAGATGPAISAPELVAAGIDDLQVQFDVRDAATGQVRIYDAGGAPLADGSTASAATGWDRVVAVRVFLLVRAQAGEGGYAPGSRTYTLGSRQITFDDYIPRQVMSSVFSLRNRR